MNEEEFFRLMRSGLGRAIRYAKTHDVQEFQRSILACCLHCQAIDPQFEGTYAVYISDLLEQVPNKAFYRDELLKALPGHGDDWDALHRFCLVGYLASDGDEDAKKVMYESFRPGPKRGESIGSNFVELDGIDGFLFAADKIGALLIAAPDEGYLLSVTIENCGEQETLTALRQAAAVNPRLAAYRAVAEARWIESRTCGSRTQAVTDLSYEQLKPNLLETKTYWITRWGEKASEADLLLAAQHLIVAVDAREQLAYLRIFAWRPFPLDPHVLLALAELEQEDVQFAAVRALTQIVDPAVREMAFRLVESRSACREDAINLLARNYQPGDHEIALGWFEAETDREILHRFEIDMFKFWEEHADDETELRMLHALYDRGPCSFCREHVVSRLIARNAFTDEMRADCAFDANDEIRKLVAAIFEQQDGG